MAAPAEKESGDAALPLACVPDSIAPVDRAPHFALISRLFRERMQERQTLDDGYAFRFAAQDFTDLARFVENERRCCPFLTFLLEVAPVDGPLWLRILGPAGTPEFLDAELAERA